MVFNCAICSATTKSINIFDLYIGQGRQGCVTYNSIS